MIIRLTPEERHLFYRCAALGQLDDVHVVISKPMEVFSLCSYLFTDIHDMGIFNIQQNLYAR